MDTKGGRVTIDMSGKILSCRAKATLDPAGVEIDAGSNWDGTGYRTVKPKLKEAPMTFDRGNFAWDEAMMLSTFDLTFVEDDVGVTHYFTQATFVGTPSIDTETGEVSGLSVKSDRYRQVRG